MSQAVHRRMHPLSDLSTYLGRSQKTCYLYAGQEYFPIYEVPGKRGVYVDLDEVDAGMARNTRRFNGAKITRLPARPEVVTR